VHQAGRTYASDMPRVESHQIVVIGGGPAGVSAALECFDIQLDVILLEAGSQLGGQLADVPNSIRNVAAGNFENGEALRQALERSAVILGDRVRLSHRVTGLNLADRRVETDRGQFAADVFLVATGTSKPYLPGAADGAFGGDVTYQLESDLDRFVGRTVAVIGGGDSATLDALALARAGSKVKLVHRSEKLTARRNIVEQVEGEPSIEDLSGWELQSARGDDRLEEIVLIHPATGETRVHAVGGLVVKIGRSPSTGFLVDEVDLDRRGAIVVDEQLRSSRAEVFGAGDVVSGAYARAATAMGQGVLAGRSILRFLEDATRIR
jgi:thioredoxin reductase (NADPH)